MPGVMRDVMQDLVSGAHSARDGVINTLDAVGRRTRAANAALADRVRALQLTRPERDTRFDPEDEWELPAPVTGTARTTGTVGPRADRDAYEDDENEDSRTWLR